ncbi:MAG: UDP-3-O-(3-hydroxymyristoyl)glucosamine N-acyltransferase [Bacteroidia bacterium]|nr:UDP-3-O-(3-hydroxymyristoyl)glucosamine N-acyltransferase [Bacteroidia bacterium]MCC6767678.1 UDP-3-O-(3-hydroxymyristoyl)glucosamine N-acyltransferase [Bacteroidia bacterium]
MEFTAQQIADLLGGRVEGNPEVKISRLSKIEEGQPGSLSFLANPKYEEHIYRTQASVVIVAESFVPEQPVQANLIRVSNPYKSFAVLLETYNKINIGKSGREQPHYIAATAEIGENPYIGAFVYIGENARIGRDVKLYPGVYIGDNVQIGDNTIIYPGVKVYSETSIGKDCRIHAGVIIGADGFGFAPQDDTNYLKVAQIGNVIIEDHVEIGSNTTIDRATLGSTIIRKGVKLDNLIQIAHNVEIGEHTVIAAQTGVAGSTKIGRFCMIGGQVGIIGHLTIADKVKIAAQSGVGASILNEGEIIQGSPAFGIGEYKKAYIGFRKLPELQAKLEELEKLMKEIQELNNG